MRACFLSGRVEVFSWSQEPEESDDAEVQDVAVERSVHVVLELQGVKDALEDGDVGWVGTCGWAVFIFESLEEADEERMEV